MQIFQVVCLYEKGIILRREILERETLLLASNLDHLRDLLDANLTEGVKVEN